jgi:hypothetical protein
LQRFSWKAHETEEENYVRLDEETANCYFGDEDFLQFLKD